MTAGGTLGRICQDGEVVIRQGEAGDCLYVVQEGEFEIVHELDGRETVLRVARKDEIFGEMGIFEKAVRSATVRARGAGRVLTLDKKNFMRRINEDPTLAFRVVETMSRRVRQLSDQVAELTRELQRRGTGQP
jgi:ATP-binding cassette subfamily B protein